MAIDLDKMAADAAQHGWHVAASEDDLNALLVRCRNLESIVLAGDDPVVRLIKRDARDAALEEAAKEVDEFTDECECSKAIARVVRGMKEKPE